MCARTFTSKLGASSLLSEWSGRNCHCGQSAARLAAKVHIDFSTFGLNTANGKTTAKKINAITSNVHSNQVAISEFSSSELLSGHLLNYNSNELLDQAALVGQLAHLSADDQSSSTYLTTNLNHTGNGANSFIDLDSGAHLRPLVTGIHNQLGQNVAADIRKRLEQIKTNGMKHLRQDHNQTFSSSAKAATQLQVDESQLDGSALAVHSSLTNLGELSVDDDVDVLGNFQERFARANNSRNSYNGFTFKV